MKRAPLGRLAVSIARDKHRHVYRYDREASTVAGAEVRKCTRCPKIAVRRKEQA